MAATIKDIARSTGLGIATISKYLNGGRVRPDNRKLIDDAIRDMNYVPNEIARSLKTNHTKAIGVVIPELSNIFITSIITMMEDLLRKKGYAVIICDCRSDKMLELDAVTFLVNKRVDGLICMPSDPSGESLKPAVDAKLPIVLVDRMIKHLAQHVSAVVVDNVDATEMATKHLLDLGHRDIGLILGNSGIYTTQLRRQGYLNAFSAINTTPRAELIRMSDYTTEGGYHEMKSLLSGNNPPSAVLVTNYEMTVGAMLAIHELNINIPDDLSFIGFDKVDIFTKLFPGLTIIKQPLESIGEAVARQLLLLLNTKETRFNQMITLSVQYVEGKSTKQLTV